jgi:hypothetical protein
MINFVFFACTSSIIARHLALNSPAAIVFKSSTSPWSSYHGHHGMVRRVSYEVQCLHRRYTTPRHKQCRRQSHRPHICHPDRSEAQRRDLQCASESTQSLRPTAGGHPVNPGAITAESACAGLWISAKGINPGLKRETWATRFFLSRVAASGQATSDR